jgi:hypothetical protein
MLRAGMHVHVVLCFVVLCFVVMLSARGAEMGMELLTDYTEG